MGPTSGQWNQFGNMNPRYPGGPGFNIPHPNYNNHYGGQQMPMHQNYPPYSNGSYQNGSNNQGHGNPMYRGAPPPGYGQHFGNPPPGMMNNSHRGPNSNQGYSQNGSYQYLPPNGAPPMNRPPISQSGSK
jgi:hypothetical protein